jgi:hypothetical protein
MAAISLGFAVINSTTLSKSLYRASSILSRSAVTPGLLRTKCNSATSCLDQKNPNVRGNNPQI